MDKCCVIVVAGGTGCRFGGDLPKQFLKLCNTPVLKHSLLAFEENKAVDKIILVTCKEHLERTHALATPKVTNVIAGGSCRQQSVHNAVQLLESTGFVGIVLVHDAARPFVDDADIFAVIAAAKEHGAATVATAVTDTIKLVTDGTIEKTLPKERLFAVQTPQAFAAEILYQAHNISKGQEAYDDCQLVEKMGMSPKIVLGSPLNIKITHKNDLEIAENILKSRVKR